MATAPSPRYVSPQPPTGCCADATHGGVLLCQAWDHKCLVLHTPGLLSCGWRTRLQTHTVGTPWWHLCVVNGDQTDCPKRPALPLSLLAHTFHPLCVCACACAYDRRCPACSQEEYKLAYDKLHGTSDGFEEMWKKLDADGDGSLTVDELAAHYGFSMDSDTSNEMTDEQILEALQMQSALVELNSKKEEEKKPEEKVADAKKEKKEVVKDPTLEIVSLEKKDPTKQAEINFLEACQLGDLTSSDPDKITIAASLKLHSEGKCNVRIADHVGEMGAHKLARFKVTSTNEAQYKATLKDLFEAMKAAAKKAGKTLAGDINHQDKAGKTPLFMAVEHKNLVMIEALYALGADGPDSLLCNGTGWTVLHAAVNTDALDVLKKLRQFFTPARTKLLLNTADKSGREPLHIAAYKCSEEMVSFLMELGATNKKKDSAGNNPAALAARSGRRKSREILEGTLPVEEPKKAEEAKPAEEPKKA